MAAIVACGECLMDMVPDEQGCFCPHPGGAPANVAVAAARLGHGAAFLGKHGDDAFGERLVTHLRDCEVDTTGFTATEEAKTALAFIQYREGKVPEFSFYRDPGADELLRPQDLPGTLLDGARAFHFGSISLYSEPAASATRAAARRVRDAGGLVSYDPNLRPAIMATRDGALEAAHDGLGLAHVVKLSAEELIEITGLPAEGDALAALLDRGVGLVAITHGAEGATLATKRWRVDRPGEAVTPVDTTGAGDAFTAALLTALLEQGVTPPALTDLDEPTLAALADWANRVAARSTTAAGATEGLARPESPISGI